MGMEEALDFWISQLKITGREFHPELVKAAQVVLPRVLAYGQQDPTAAVELLANVCSQVSISVFRQGLIPLDRNGEPIQDLQQYVLRSFFKKANHPYVTSAQRCEISGMEDTQQSSDSGAGQQKTEDHAQFWELFDRLEPKMQTIFQWREYCGYRWRLVGKLVGMSGHAAEVYYTRGIERFRKELEQELHQHRCKKILVFKPVKDSATEDK